MWQNNYSYNPSAPSELLKGVNFNTISGGKSRRRGRGKRSSYSSKTKKSGFWGFFLNKCGCKSRRRSRRRL